MRDGTTGHHHHHIIFIVILSPRSLGKTNGKRRGSCRRESWSGPEAAWCSTMGGASPKEGTGEATACPMTPTQMVLSTTAHFPLSQPAPNKMPCATRAEHHYTETPPAPPTKPLMPLPNLPTHQLAGLSQRNSPFPPSSFRPRATPPKWGRRGRVRGEGEGSQPGEGGRGVGAGRRREGRRRERAGEGERTPQWWWRECTVMRNRQVQGWEPEKG